MKLARLILQNTSIHILGRAIGVLIGVFTIGLLTRYLGQSRFGAYSTIIAFIMLSTIIADLGLYMITLKTLAKPKADESILFSNILSLRIMSGLIMVLIASSVVWLFPYPLIVKQGIILYSIVAWISLVDQIFIAGLQKHLSMQRVAIAEVINKTIILLFVIIAIALKLDLLFIISGHIAAIIIHTLLNYAKVKQLIDISIQINLTIWKKILIASLPIAFSSIFTMIYFRADTLFLSIYQSQEDVGIYGAPYRALEVLISFAPLFMGLVMPVLTKAAGDNKKFEHVFQKTLDALSVIAFLLIAVTIPLAQPIITLIAGIEFIKSAGILQILIIATACIYLAHLTTYSVIALGKQKQMIKYYILAAILAVTGYVTLIPLYTYWAAAWVTLAVEAFILLATLNMVKKTIPINISKKILLKSLAAAILSIAIITPIKDMSIFISLPIGICAYATLIYLLKVINVKEIKQIFRNDNQDV